MYLPAHFAAPDREAMHALIDAHPFGLLVGLDGHGAPRADAMPFLLDRGTGSHGLLLAHVARANPLWRESAGREVLVVFQGPHGYVSPGWYATKAETGKVVPTWNYLMVQARGRLEPVEDRDALRALVRALTAQHEAAMPTPWAVEDAPADYVDAMLRGIVGLRIELTALVGKWKVGQNRNAADRAGAAAGMRTHPGSGSDTERLADWMEPGAD